MTTVYLYLQPRVSLVLTTDRTLRTTYELLQSFTDYSIALVHLPRITASYKLPLDDRAKQELNFLSTLEPSVPIDDPDPLPPRKKGTYYHIPRRLRKKGSRPGMAEYWKARGKPEGLKREGPRTYRERAKMAQSCRQHAAEYWRISITDDKVEKRIMAPKALYPTKDDVPIPEGWRRGRSKLYMDKLAGWVDDWSASQKANRWPNKKRKPSQED